MLLFPGQAGPMVFLQDAMRDLHDANRTHVLQRIEKRARFQAGHDERVNFDEVKRLASAAVSLCASGDSAGIREAADGILSMTAPPLADPGPYVPNDQLDGIEVQFRAVSAGQMRRFKDELDRQNEQTRKAETREALIESDEKALGIVSAFLSQAVVRMRFETVEGVQEHEMSEALFEAIRFSGVLAAVHSCAQAFQDLPPKKAVRFGSSPRSTSMSASTVTAAAPANSVLSAAGVVPRSLMVADESSTAPSTKPTDAPSATSGTTPTSSGHSTWREQPETPWASTPSST